MVSVYARVDATRFIKDVKAVAKNVEAAGNTLAAKAAEAGATEMKKLISTRGTNKPWTRPTKGRKTGRVKTTSAPGRIDSGDMLNAVTSRVEQGPKQTIATFGWIGANPQDRQYFEAQEKGFLAGGFRPPVNVPGMFALRDARIYVSQVVLPKLARQNIARLTRGR